MLEEISADCLDRIQNSVLKNHARVFCDIEIDFRNQVLKYGLPFAEANSIEIFDKCVEHLQQRGLTLSNDRNSLHVGWISPSCVQCRKGLETLTVGISVQCPRQCYFCFNPNQANYERLLHNTEDIKAKLDERFLHGELLSDIALTGGEPLIHKREVYDFFEHANILYPHAYTRLYTSGAFLDEATLEQLKQVGLDEIRFSIKMDEPAEVRKQLIDLIELSERFIQNVLVEMPVMPDCVPEMKELMQELNHRGVSGINLLELCFPLHNAYEFARRGYLIKRTPYRVLYEYWYAGGLPIDGSEFACLELLKYAIDNNMQMGVHYCSLENKFSGQVYQQNAPFARLFKFYLLSQKDYFLKCAKAFGTDAESLAQMFKFTGISNFSYDEHAQVIEFPISYIQELPEQFQNIELTISYNIVEEKQGHPTLRELKLSLTSPATFEYLTDI